MTGTVSYITKGGFEEQYLSLRQKEGRLYSDTELFNLPEIPRDHLHYAEWQIRKESAKRLRNYFEKRSSLIKILEIGCGNGWLSHQLAEISGSEIMRNMRNGGAFE